MTNDELMTTWCRMWSEDPALAHDLMTDSCTQWSGQTDGLDAVVGPGQQERFVTAYRALHVNVFSPRMLVDGGDRFAYLWDVTHPDGSVVTGADVNVLRGGRVEQNWTFVSGRQAPPGGPDSPVGDPADAGDLADLADRWTAVWDGRGALAAALVRDDFTLFAGTGSPDARLRGPAALTDAADQQRAGGPGSATGIHREPVLDVARQRIALLRTAPDAAHPVAVDLLTVSNGRVAAAWSLTGDRPFRY